MHNKFSQFWNLGKPPPPYFAQNFKMLLHKKCPRTFELLLKNVRVLAQREGLKRHLFYSYFVDRSFTTPFPPFPTGIYNFLFCQILQNMYLKKNPKLPFKRLKKYNHKKTLSTLPDTPQPQPHPSKF